MQVKVLRCKHTQLVNIIISQSLFKMDWGKVENCYAVRQIKMSLLAYLLIISTEFKSLHF